MNDEVLIPDWPAPYGVSACITTRKAHNLALHVGDCEAHVIASRDALRSSMGFSHAQWLHQIHGTRIVKAIDSGLIDTADGCYTKQLNLACAVLTADCLPVLICDRQGTQVAAIHAGWRGLSAGILAESVETFTALPSELLVYLGPAISQTHFEVGLDVFDAFLKTAKNPTQIEAIKKAFIPCVEHPDKFFADLYAIATAELQALGVTAIFGGGRCTFDEDETFYSFRRDGQTGRMASLIWLSRP